MAMKAYYFGLPGRGLAINLAFEIGGIAYENIVVDFKDWPTLKPTTPYKQLPVLKVGDKTIAQTNTILRFIGKKGGLYPTDDMEAAYVDELMDALEAISGQLFGKPPTPETKEEYRARLNSEVLPALFGDLEKRLAEVGTATGHSVGSGFTTADLKFYQMNALFECGFLDGISKDLLLGDSFPRIKAIVNAVAIHQAVVAFNSKS